MKNKFLVAGVDEVGRGCLSGPVFSSAVIFKKNIKKSIIKDSKKINFEKRLILDRYIKKNSYYALGMASVKEIEKFNILNATLISMKRAIKNLKKKPEIVLIDGNKMPKINNYKLKNIIKGDEKIPEISAASIIAKVSRDRLVSQLSKKFKNYYWNKNSGYGTKDHIKAIRKFGVTKYHRKTFQPIYNILSLK